MLILPEWKEKNFFLSTKRSSSFSEATDGAGPCGLQSIPISFSFDFDSVETKQLELHHSMLFFGTILTLLSRSAGCKYLFTHVICVLVCQHVVYRLTAKQSKKRLIYAFLFA